MNLSVFMIWILVLTNKDSTIKSAQLSYLIKQFLIGHLPMVASSRLGTIVRHLEISVIAVSQLYSSYWVLLLTVAPGLNSLEEIVELQ